MILLLEFSNELLLQISSELGHERNISAFSRTNRRLYFLLRKFLIQYNVCNSESSALLWAGRYGDEGLARKVLAEGGTAQVTGRQRPWSPLTLAAANEHENLVRLFLSCEELDTNWSSENNYRTALSFAAECGNLAIVETLLITGRANPNESFGDPLALACENGHQPIVELLLRQNAIDLRPIFFRGFTPLSRAVSKGHLRIAKLLLETAHVDPNDEEPFGNRTPFYWAAWRGQIGVVELLLAQNDVVPDRAYDMNRTALSVAAGCGHLGVVRLLLTKARVRPDTTDIHGRTPLHWAINWAYDNDDELFQGSSNHRTENASDQEETLTNIVELLLAHGANPDSKDDNQRTPITLAIERRRHKVAKLLLDTGKIDLTCKDDEGRTPLMWAKIMEDEEIARLLQSGEC